MGSMYVKRCLHTTRLCVSSPDSPFSPKATFTLTIHFCFSLPFLILPSTSIFVTLFPTYSSSLLVTCLHHSNLLSCTFFGDFSHFYCPSNSFFPYSAHFGGPTHPSQHPNFCHIQLLLVCLRCYPCLRHILKQN